MFFVLVLAVSEASANGSGIGCGTIILVGKAGRLLISGQAKNKNSRSAVD
jgi:hypothetical protein